MLRIGQVGLGRLGMQYARILHRYIVHARLVSVCSLDTAELEKCKKMIPHVNTFQSFSEMLEASELDAVVIVSTTGMHIPHIKESLGAGLHVFCEKPLAVSPSACFDVVDYASSFPDSIVMVGFNRRYDSSYQAAMEEVKKGTIGEPFLFRSQTVDLDSVAEFQLKFAQNSGGIFIDYNVHDIDLMRWFLNTEVERVWSLGGAYKFPGFKRLNDADYVVSTCQMTNGSMAVFTAGRVATHGHDTYTEITGTEGTLRVGRPATKDFLEIYDRSGMRKEILTSFWDRFEKAFTRMIQDFIDCISHNRTPKLNLYNAAKASEVADACKKSYQTGEIVYLS